MKHGFIKDLLAYTLLNKLIPAPLKLFKVALNPLHRMFYNFAGSCITLHFNLLLLLFCFVFNENLRPSTIDVSHVEVIEAETDTT